ncbi:MAG: DivIVA domain-containing protein [Bradymonadaceae bacterium]
MLKLSAEDIANQSFQRCFRGYDPDQVEEFLEAVAREWEHLVSLVKQARERAAERADELEEYKDREESLQDALEMAKKVSDEIKEKAEREAELKIADAEVEADRILAEVEEEVASLREDIQSLKKQRNRYKAELRSLVNNHLEMIDRMDDEPSFEGEISRSPTPATPEEAAEPVEDDDIEFSEPASDRSDEPDESSPDDDSAPRIRDSHH